MSRARDDILAGLRARLGAAAPLATEGERARLLPPSFVREAPDLTALFAHKLSLAMASLSRIEDWRDLPAHIAALLKERSLPPRLAIAPEPAWAALDWLGAGLEAGALDPLAPATVLSGALAGIAETGSLVLTTAGASRPLHNLLAELHIVALDAARIVPDLEGAWRAATAAGVPRGTVLVTGPSRTGDIEMSLELGAHGAVALHVVLAGPLVNG